MWRRYCRAHDCPTRQERLAMFPCGHVFQLHRPCGAFDPAALLSASDCFNAAFNSATVMSQTCFVIGVFLGVCVVLLDVDVDDVFCSKVAVGDFQATDVSVALPKSGGKSVAIRRNEIAVRVGVNFDFIIRQHDGDFGFSIAASIFDKQFHFLVCVFRRFIRRPVGFLGGQNLAPDVSEAVFLFVVATVVVVSHFRFGFVSVWLLVVVVDARNEHCGGQDRHSDRVHMCLPFGVCVLVVSSVRVDQVAHTDAKLSFVVRFNFFIERINCGRLLLYCIDDLRALVSRSRLQTQSYVIP
jgi:hypothetical protein